MSNEDPEAPPPQILPADPSWSQPPNASYIPPQSTGMDELIPTKNMSALIAYYCAIFSLTVCFAPILGPAAIILGRKGLKAIDAQPGLPGRTHALIGIILGGFMSLVSVAIIILIVIGIVKSNH